MAGWLARSLALQFLIMAPIHGLRPMASYRAIELGAGSFDLGVVAASYAALSLVAAVPVGRGADRWGETSLVMGGAALVTGSAVLMVLAGSVFAVVLTQAILGLGQVVTLIGLQTLIANRGTSHERDARFGLFTVVGSLGQMAGPVAAGFLLTRSTGSLGAVFLSLAAVAALGNILTVSFLLRPAPPTNDDVANGPAMPPLTRTVGVVLRQPNVPHAMSASLATLTTIDLLIVYLPAYGEARGISAATVGTLLGARALAGMASRLLMVPLLRWLGRRRLLITGLMLPALAIVAVPTTASTPLLYTVMIVAGFGLGLGQPLSLAWITDQVPPTLRGTAIGVRLTGNRLGQLAVPIGVGAIAGATGVGAIFVAMSAMLGASATLVTRTR